MAGEKITISSDEVNSSNVDIRIKQQDLITRAQEHYQQVAAVPSTNRSGFFRRAIVYMTLFGLLGGLLAWGAGEGVYRLGRTGAESYREYFQQVREIEADHDSNKITATEAADKKSKLDATMADNPYRQLEKQESSGEIPESEVNLRLTILLNHDWWVSAIANSLFWGVVAMLISLALAMAEGAVGKNFRAMLVGGVVGALIGFGGGVIVSLFVDHLYAALQGQADDPSFGRQMLARTIGWMIAGLFLSIAPGIAMRSFKKTLLGLLGGLIGGMIGGLLFDPITYLTNSDVLSRLAGITAIGVLAGLATALIEQAAKTGWLKVVAGLIAGKQFILYRNPTQIGSAPTCEIYLFKDPQIAPRHAAVHVIPSGYELQDLGSGLPTFVNGRQVSRVRLKNGDQIQIGATQFAFQEKQKGQG